MLFKNYNEDFVVLSINHKKSEDSYFYDQKEELLY